MGTKNISLPRELEEYIDAKVASGEYSHASEVVRDGLRLLMQREVERLEWLRNAVAQGVASTDRGESVSAEEAFAHVRARGKARLASRPKSK